MSKKREFRRLVGEIRTEVVDGKKKIVGYGAVYNQLSEPMKIGNRTVRERVMPGAFDKCLASNPDIRGLINHDPNMILGRTSAGTMRVSSDGHGVRYEIDPPDTTYASDLMKSLARGDINQSSFGFYTVDDGYVPGDDGFMVRELREVDCFDMSPVTFPAYNGATSGLRSQEEMRAMFPDGIPESLESESTMPTEKRVNDNGCDCDCTECQDDDNCEACSMESCDDSECASAGCPMQARSGKKQSEKRGDAKTKTVGGKVLHASDFAHVGDAEDPSTWKLPIHDASHVRNALARFNQVQGLSKEEKDAAWKKILAAAKKFGIKVSEENASKLYGASYRDAKATLRAIDPDNDGDDDEPLIDALCDARSTCCAVADTASSALWSFWNGDSEMCDPLLKAFVEQVKVLTDRLQVAVEQAEKELAEQKAAQPAPELNSRRQRYQELFVAKK